MFTPTDPQTADAPGVGLPALARVARLAAVSTGAPWAMVNFHAGNAFTIGAAYGLPDAVQPGLAIVAAAVPCDLTAAAGAPLASADASRDPRLADRSTVRLLGIRGYLGVPFHDAAGHVAGTVCVMDPAPRSWQPADLECLRDLAALVEDELTLRRELAEHVAHQTALEAQLGHVQKLEALGRLAGGVAHDFNNLLTVVGTSARFVREAVREAVRDALPPALAGEAEGDLDEIDHAVERAGALTRQLLTFSRARDAEPRHTSAADVVRAVEQMARRVVGEDVEVLSLVDAAAGAVLADPGQLEQVLLNLVVNARDAMPDGGVLVLEARRLDLAPGESGCAGAAPGSWAVLEVSDTGVGMSEATQARAFEPFFTTKPVGQGTGLGLATVYGIVTQAGGRVSVQSRPGRGTTFTILLPRVGDTADLGDAPAAAAAPPPRARRGETVLVVEDEAGVRHAARRVLERHGYCVLEARHGAEGLRVWQAHGGGVGRVHLVLTDLTMPGVNGRELVARLQARRPAQAVAVMTGYASPEPRGWAEAQGLPVVDKPFHAAALARVVHEAIDAGPLAGMLVPARAG